MFQTPLLDKRAPLTEKQCFSRIWAACAVLLLVTAIAQNVLYVVLYPALSDTFYFDLLLSVVPMYGIAIPCAYGILRRVTALHPQKARLPHGVFFLVIFVSICILTVGNLIGQSLLAFLEALLHTSAYNPIDGIMSQQSPALIFLSTVLLAPIFEELFFRKLLIDRLLPFGGWLAAFVSSLAFGLTHGNFTQCFYAFGIGMVLAYLYIHTGRLQVSIALHMLINCFSGFLLYELSVTNAISESIRNLLFMFIELFILGATFAGIVILFCSWKKIHMPVSLCILEKRRHLFCNFGMLLFLLLAGLLFLLTFI